MHYINNIIIIFLISLVITNFNDHKLYAQNNEISIIANSNFKGSLTESDLKQIFSGNMVSFPNGEKVHIIDQGDTKAGQVFYSSFVGDNFNKVKVKWTKKVLSGQMSAPKKCNSDSEVLNEVASNSNAIGYISSDKLNSSVKEIFKVSK